MVPKHGAHSVHQKSSKTSLPLRLVRNSHGSPWVSLRAKLTTCLPTLTHEGTRAGPVRSGTGTGFVATGVVRSTSSGGALGTVIGFVSLICNDCTCGRFCG